MMMMTASSPPTPSAPAAAGLTNFPTGKLNTRVVMNTYRIDHRRKVC